MKTDVSSKVLLFGEYTVLNSGVALTVPYDKFSGELCFPEAETATVETEKSNDVVKRFVDYISHLPEKDHEGLDFISLVEEVKKGIFFKSNIPQGYGLGSSGALVVAVFIRYFETARSIKKDIKNVSKENLQRMRDFLGKLENFFHGSSSGIDPLSILVNEPLLFQHSEVKRVKLPRYNKKGKNVIFLLDSEIERNTQELVKEYKLKCEQPEFKYILENELASYSQNCIDSLIKNDTNSLYENLYKLIGIQLEQLDYLIPGDLKGKVQTGIDSKEYYLKICGSGGGGYMLGFTQDWDSTEKSLQEYRLDVIHRY